MVKRFNSGSYDWRGSGRKELRDEGDGYLRASARNRPLGVERIMLYRTRKTKTMTEELKSGMYGNRW